MMVRRRIRLGLRTWQRGVLVALATLGAACGGGPTRIFAPRYPGPARAPTSRDKILIVGTKPPCDYDVIGTIFTRGVDEFAEFAAAAGGDGVYDTRCQLRTEQHTIFIPSSASVAAANGLAKTAPSSVETFQTTSSDCAARVFVCKGGRR
jgi:hypothetical protein